MSKVNVGKDVVNGIADLAGCRTNESVHTVAIEKQHASEVRKNGVFEARTNGSLHIGVGKKRFSRHLVHPNVRKDVDGVLAKDVEEVVGRNDRANVGSKRTVGKR